MTLSVSGTTVVNQNRSFVLGTATPGSPATGMIRYNSSLAQFEVYNGSAWASIIYTASVTSPAWAWGAGQNGRLGTNNTTNTASPVSVVGGFTDWTQISATNGASHTTALRSNGTAWAWGLNSNGQLGIGNTTSQLSPVSVVGGFTDWVQISAGTSHTAAIRSNGTAWGWGNNYAGKLGDNTTTNRSSPVSVVGGFTDWVQISAGPSHTSAVRANGTAWGWGYQFSYGGGKLGDGTKTNRSSPVSVVGGFTDWVQISAGGNHTAAIRANGTAWCWGYNGVRALGDGTNIISRLSPVSVVGGFTDWVQISAGGSHTAAVRASGTAWCWGNNPFGQLGNGNTTLQNSPVSVVGGFTDWVQISTGNTHTAALRSNGTAWAWGDNGSGGGTTSRLGDGTATNRSSPVSVVGGFTDWVQISAASIHTVALRAI